VKRQGVGERTDYILAAGHHCPHKRDRLSILTFNRRRAVMLFTIAIILLVLWALGMVSGAAVGNFIHLLLVAAVIMVLIQIIGGGGRRTL
jgi:hypothetical protein